MRQASKDYQKYKLMKQNATESESSHLTLPVEDVSKEQIKINVENNLDDGKKSMRDSQDRRDDSDNNTNKLDVTHDVQQNNMIETENKDTNSTPKKKQGLLHYFYLAKLFPFLDF